MTLQIRRYAQLPPIVPTPLDDIWEVVVPVARMNLVNNPSFETNTTNWTAIGGSIARSTTQQYHGAYSLAITPTAATTDGARFDTWSSTSGTLYAYSAKVFGQASVPYKLCLETTGAVELASVAVLGTGRWRWIYGYYLETSSTTRRVTIRKNGSADTHTFYLDGVQVEAIVAGEIASTYLDGDQPGLVPNQQPPAYFWNGTPHASTSSRSGLTRAGGMVFRFKDFNFFLMAIIGLGLAVPQNVATPYARIDGSFDDYTRKPERQFSIVGNFAGRNYQELRDYRSSLAAYLDRDLAGLDQQLILRHHLEDPCGTILSDIARIPCKYVSGLGGNTNNQAGETTPISFTQYLPLIQADNEAGTALNVQLSLSNLSRIALRSPTGVWSALSTGANGNIWSLLWASDGKLYAGGEFSTIGGVGANRIAYWDGAAWNAMGTGGAGVSAVYRMVEGPDGAIYAAGDFTSMGGVANTARLAKWTPGTATWSSITTTASADNTVFALTFDTLGNLYASGDFLNINGVAATRIAKYNGTTWTALAGGLAASSRGLIYGRDGKLYAAAQNDFDRWNGTAWTNIGGVSGGTADKVAFGLDGSVYGGGTYTAVGGVTATAIAKYKGVAWTALGSGVLMSTGSTEVDDIAPAPDGTVYVGGILDTAGSITTVHGIARWNGSAWVYIDLDIAWSSVKAIALKRDGTLAMGGSGATSTGTSAATTTVTNTGTARAYPTLTIKGPTTGTSRIYQLTNYTTGRTIYLNLTINAGETITMVFKPDALSFTSDFQGDIASTILPGSNTAEFFLQPGANTISFFAAASSVTATMHWQPSYASLDDIP